MFSRHVSRLLLKLDPPPYMIKKIPLSDETSFMYWENLLKTYIARNLLQYSNSAMTFGFIAEGYTTTNAIIC